MLGDPPGGAAYYMQNSRVLIVDDEPEIIQALGDLYRANGAEVLNSTDGRQALEIARREQPDLVLLDVMMPGMDGYEICRCIKDSERTRRIPVIMVTGLGDLGHKLKGLNAGADDFLTKPVNSSELLTRSRALLRVKKLNDELEGAYRSLADIASYTNALLRHFDPSGFDAHQSLGGSWSFSWAREPAPTAGPSGCCCSAAARTKPGRLGVISGRTPSFCATTWAPACPRSR